MTHPGCRAVVQPLLRNHCLGNAVAREQLACCRLSPFREPAVVNQLHTTKQAALCSTSSPHRHVMICNNIDLTCSIIHPPFHVCMLCNSQGGPVANCKLLTLLLPPLPSCRCFRHDDILCCHLEASSSRCQHTLLPQPMYDSSSSLGIPVSVDSRSPAKAHKRSTVVQHLHAGCRQSVHVDSSQHFQ